MNEVRCTDYQFQFKQTWFGVVLMYREAVPDSYGDFKWGRWRKAKWSDMYLYKKAHQHELRTSKPHHQSDETKLRTRTACAKLRDMRLD